MRTLLGGERGARPSGYQPHYLRRTSQFGMASGAAKIVMIGDSGQSSCPRQRTTIMEIFPHSRRCRARLDQICSRQYRLAFLMIEIDDVLGGTPADQFEQAYGRIVGRLKTCAGGVVAELLIVPDLADDVRIRVNVSSCESGRSPPCWASTH